MRKESEIVIIGAGIMGSSLAYHLAKRGKEVTVLEMNEICSGTSSTTAAWLWPSDKRPMYYGRLAKDAYDMYLTLEEELGADFELRINGSIEIARNQEELEDLKKLSAGCVELGYNARILTPEEVREMEPAIREDIVGANYVESDGHLNPFLLVNAYIQAAKKFGAEVNTYTKVEDFILEDNRITEIVTNKGNIKPGLVICAAGIYSRGLGKKLGLDAHVKPERGFTLVTEKLPHVLNHTVCGARQTVSGNIILGFIADKVDDDCLDRRMYIRGLNWAAKDALNDFPSFKDINIIRSYTGIRCKPEDKVPILGPTEKIENFWFHLAHSAFSVNPACSSRIAEVICGERSMDTLEEFKYTRFKD